VAPARSLWRDRHFVRFWASRSLGFFGIEISLLALPLTAVVTLGAAPAQVSFLAAAETAPFLLFGLAAGVWVDRWRRTPLLIGSDLVRAAAIVTVPVTVWLGTMTMTHLYLVAFAAGSCSLLATVTYQSLIPGVAGREQLVEANAMFEVGSSLAESAGPGLGGLLVQWLTPPIALLLDASAFVMSALTLTGFEAPATPEAVRHSIARDVADGLRFVLGHGALRAVVICGLFDNLLGAGLFTPLFVVHAARNLSLGPATIGLLFATAGAGTFAGALLAAGITGTLGVRNALVIAQASTGIARLVLATVAAATGAGLPLLLAAECLHGMSMPVFNVNVISLRQSVASDALQGRVNATVGFLLVGAIPIGAAGGGLLAAHIGVHGALMLAAIGTCAITLLLLVPATRSLKHTSQFAA
jgi:MFS family permease